MHFHLAAILALLCVFRLVLFPHAKVLYSSIWEFFLKTFFNHVRLSKLVSFVCVICSQFICHLAKIVLMHRCSTGNYLLRSWLFVQFGIICDMFQQCYFQKWCLLFKVYVAVSSIDHVGKERSSQKCMSLWLISVYNLFCNVCIRIDIFMTIAAFEQLCNFEILKNLLVNYCLFEWVHDNSWWKFFLDLS